MEASDSGSDGGPTLAGGGEPADPASADEPRPPPAPLPSPAPDTPPPIAIVEVADRTGALTAAQTAWLIEHVTLALRELNAGGEMRLAVVADDEMARAHERHKNVPGTTDVLTFDLSSPTDPGTLDVDALVCLDEARRRGDELGHPPEHELLLYAVHAALHCLGRDDAEPADAEAMHAEEDRVLSAIGVGPVYAAARTTPPEPNKPGDDR